MSENKNLELWNKVEKTNPKYTKKAKISGMSITSISPQYQIMQVTEQFGVYGKEWGFKSIELDYTLVDKKFFKDKTEGTYPKVKVIGKEESNMGMVIFKAVFFFPGGEFPIINSISLFTNNDKTKLDDQFAKKVETDTLTKAISKLGFNADIFLGKFDDVRYVSEITAEFNKLTSKEIEGITEKVKQCLDIKGLSAIYNSDIRIKTNDALKPLFSERRKEIENI